MRTFKSRKESDLFAYAGAILRINLSNESISSEPTSKYAREWLGSSGMAVKILYDDLKPWVTPFEPANELIFGAGPLIGTLAPGANKISASTLGPMTGGWASGHSDSYVGGEIKYSGYDLIIIEGKATRPVYLSIQDDRISFRSASHLWGKSTWETLAMIRQDLDDPALHVISIGPAGENLVRGACIIQDRARAIGRCGIGAVMGSKNLKAIIAKGTGAVQVADPGRFMQAVKRCREMIQAIPARKVVSRYGTLTLLPGKQEKCQLCYKNFQETRVPDDLAESINPMKSSDQYRISHISFPGCAIGGCGRMLHITEGPYAGLKTEACQFEAVTTLQTRLAISEPTFMYKANALCNQLGLDVDAAGGAIGWAMECFQRGIIDEKDTDGLKLQWGDAGVVLELIGKIARREGFGHILAEGCARASDLIGRDSGYYAMHVKKQDLYENCRGSNGWALGVTTSTRGGGHTTGSVGLECYAHLEAEKARALFNLKPTENPHKPEEYEGKAKEVTYMETLCRVCNSLGVCLFHSVWGDLGGLDLRNLAELYSAATGWETSEKDFQTMAMRQLNIEKAFNLRHTDFGRKDDMPPPRDLSEPIPTGAMAGWKIDVHRWNKMLDEYYELHGWDKETGYPKRSTLAELGLSYVADDLEKIGRLGPP